MLPWRRFGAEYGSYDCCPPMSQAALPASSPVVEYLGDPRGVALRKAIEKVRRSIEKVRPFARQGLSESRKMPKSLVAADETSLGGELPRPHDGGSGPVWPWPTPAPNTVGNPPSLMLRQHAPSCMPRVGELAVAQNGCAVRWCFLSTQYLWWLGDCASSSNPPVIQPLRPLLSYGRLRSTT